MPLRQRRRLQGPAMCSAAQRCAVQLSGVQCSLPANYVVCGVVVVVLAYCAEVRKAPVELAAEKHLKGDHKGQVGTRLREKRACLRRTRGTNLKLLGPNKTQGAVFDMVGMGTGR